jgi:hypothetical protein
MWLQSLKGIAFPLPAKAGSLRAMKTYENGIRVGKPARGWIVRVDGHP